MCIDRLTPPSPSRHETAGFIVLSLLLLAPLAVSGSANVNEKMGFVLPRVHSGDEPHYLIQINSLLDDGDLDLANNYAAVHMGGDAAGQYNSGAALDHHVGWFVDGRIIYWNAFYESDPDLWDIDESGHFTPTLRSDVSAKSVPTGLPEYPRGSPWLAIILAVILCPLQGTAWVEPAAIACSTVAVVASLFMFRSLVSPYSKNSRDLFLAASITFLGTPIWHYGQTLFTEPYLLLCVLGAYTAYLRHSKQFAAGCFLATAILIKPAYVLLVLPLAGDLLVGKNWLGLCRLAVPCLGAVLLFTSFNQSLYGSWRLAQRWRDGDAVFGAVALIFSPEHGLLAIAPVTLVALAASAEFVRRRTRDALILLSAAFLHFELVSSFEGWSGGYCYGPRHLVPILPFLLAAIPGAGGQATFSGATAARRTVLALCGLSIILNAIAAIFVGYVFSVHPGTLISNIF